MSTCDVLVRLRRILKVILPDSSLCERLGLEDNLPDAGLDSLRWAMLISLLQEEFQISVQEEDLRTEHFVSLAAIASFLDSKLTTF